MEGTVALRPVGAEDTAFLFRVFVDARREEFEPLGWSGEQLAAFLAPQFRAQNAHYGLNCANPDFAVILLEDRPIGRLYLDRNEGEIRVVDLALLSEYRNRGIGAALLQRVIAEATPEGRRVTLHVARNNRASRLYERLGFVTVAANEIYCLMECGG